MRFAECRCSSRGVGKEIGFPYSFLENIFEYNRTRGVLCACVVRACGSLAAALAAHHSATPAVDLLHDPITIVSRLRAGQVDMDRAVRAHAAARGGAKDCDDKQQSVRKRLRKHTSNGRLRVFSLSVVVIVQMYTTTRMIATPHWTSQATSQGGLGHHNATADCWRSYADPQDNTIEHVGGFFWQ